MKRLKELLIIYWRQNIGPFLLGLVLAIGFARLIGRLLQWDNRLILVALIVFVVQEVYKFVRFLVDCRK